MIDLECIKYFFFHIYFFLLQQVLSMSSFIFGLFSFKGVLYPLFRFHNTFSRCDPRFERNKEVITVCLREGWLGPSLCWHFQCRGPLGENAYPLQPWTCPGSLEQLFTALSNQTARFPGQWKLQSSDNPCDAFLGGQQRAASTPLSCC